MNKTVIDESEFILYDFELNDDELDFIVGGLAPVSAIGFQLGLNQNYYTAYRAPSFNAQRRQINTSAKSDNNEKRTPLKTHDGVIDFFA